MTRETPAGVETLTGSLRPIDETRYEAVYLRNDELYLSQTCGTKAIADAHLALERDALEAAGWTPQAVKDP